MSSMTILLAPMVETMFLANIPPTSAARMASPANGLSASMARMVALANKQIILPLDRVRGSYCVFVKCFTKFLKVKHYKEF